jgi:hypothetical protein
MAEDVWAKGAGVAKERSPGRLVMALAVAANGIAIAVAVAVANTAPGANALDHDGGIRVGRQFLRLEAHCSLDGAKLGLGRLMAGGRCDAMRCDVMQGANKPGNAGTDYSALR